MKWVQGYPRDNGATDMCDSARLAGMMAIVDHVDEQYLANYVIGNEAVRCPVGDAAATNPKNFTRDQLVCLAAGLWKQGREPVVEVLYAEAEKRGWHAQNTEADVPGSTKPWWNGADWLSASDRMHLRLCMGQPADVGGLLWLRAEILFNTVFTPMREPNQLICKCLLANLLPFYKKVTPKWRDAIKQYWNGWRDEPTMSFLLQDCVECDGKPYKGNSPVS